MRKKFTVIFLCILSVLGVFGLFAACGSSRLDTPTGLHIDMSSGEEILNWNDVTNAKSYVVEINGQSKQTRSTSIELSRFDLDEGENVIRVKACAEGYTDSAWAKTTFVKTASTGLAFKEVVPGEYTVTGLGGASGDIIIEDVYNGLPVTAIAENAFMASSKVLSVTIGKNVRSIGVRAFGNCAYLNSVTFADSDKLIEISDSAFQSCISLTNIELPDSVQTLGASAFAYCRGLDSVKLPSNIMSIGNGAFIGCEALQEIVIPEKVTVIGMQAFSECSSLKRITLKCENVTISSSAFSKCGETIDEDNPLTDENKLIIDLGNGVTSIGSSAFQSCSALDSIVIPDSVTSIGSGAFGSCTSLVGVKLGSGITEIGSNVFTNTAILADTEGDLIIDGWFITRKNVSDSKGDLRDLDIIGIAAYAFNGGELTSAYQLPESLVYINSNAFTKCSMSSVTIGNNVKYIGSYAFYNCVYLRTVVIGNSVEQIGDYAFAGCELLTATSSVGNKNINIPASVKRIGYKVFYDTALWNNATDIVALDNWVVGCNAEATGNLDIPSGTVGIADYAFSGCKYISGMYIPSTVDYIGVGAFSECTMLKSVSLPSGLKEINILTFYNCANLTEVTIPSGLEKIGAHAFMTCMSLRSVVIPDSVKEIGVLAFGFCDYLSSVTLGSSVESMGSYAFAYCVSLEEIALPDSLMDISSYAFYRCSALSKIDFGSGVRTIGSHAFYQCTMLSELDMPDNITAVGDYAFYKCKALWKLNIGGNVRTIGEYAFCGCENLVKAAIPDSVESVGSFAFLDCTDLVSVTLGVNLLFLGDHVFMNCHGLTIYCESSRAYSWWSSLWNSQYRPVVWDCVLSDDRTYVIGLTLSNISNGDAENGITAPQRLGWTFVGWSTSQDETVDYVAKDIANAPIGSTLYAVWEEGETKPFIVVTPEYRPGWDSMGWMSPMSGFSVLG